MPETAKKLNIHEKLLKIAEMAGVLQRSKEGYGYKYVPEEDIQAKVTAGMQLYKIMLYISLVPGTLKVDPISYEKLDKKLKQNVPVHEVIVSTEVCYTWVNTEDPSEKVESRWAYVGQMEDAAQAFGAGATYGNRYFLMKALQLATTEDDPDNYRSKQRQVEEEAKQKELIAARDKLAKRGSELIGLGATKDDIRNAVAKHTKGEGSVSEISNIILCDKIMKEFNSIEEKIKNNTQGEK